VAGVGNGNGFQGPTGCDDLLPEWAAPARRGDFGSQAMNTRPGKHTKNDGKSPFFMGKLTISMAIFNSELLNYQRV